MAISSPWMLSRLLLTGLCVALFSGGDAAFQSVKGAIEETAGTIQEEMEETAGQIQDTMGGVLDTSGEVNPGMDLGGQGLSSSEVDAAAGAWGNQEAQYPADYAAGVDGSHEVQYPTETGAGTEYYVENENEEYSEVGNGQQQGNDVLSSSELDATAGTNNNVPRTTEFYYDSVEPEAMGHEAQYQGNTVNEYEHDWDDSSEEDYGQEPEMLWQQNIVGSSDKPGLQAWNNPPPIPSTSSRGLPALPGNLPPIPGNLPPLPGNLPPIPGNLPPLPGNLPPLPGNLPPFPGNLPPLPGNLPPLPGNLPPFPGNLPPLPGNLPPFPGNLPSPSSNNAGLPSDLAAIFGRRKRSATFPSFPLQKIIDAWKNQRRLLKKKQ